MKKDISYFKNGKYMIFMINKLLSKSNLIPKIIID